MSSFALSSEVKSTLARPLEASSAAIGVVQAIAGITGPGAPVLLVGESGTGKDFLAEQIHGASHQASLPFVKLQCSRTAESTLSGYLGHLRPNGGSASALGTLFLEDVADLDPGAQAQLLASLRDGQPTNGQTLARLDRKSVV